MGKIWTSAESWIIPKALSEENVRSKYKFSGRDESMETFVKYATTSGTTISFSEY